MTDDLIIKEHLQWLRTLSIQYSSSLLTPDDWIIKNRIARKPRINLSPIQIQRKKQQVLKQVLK